MKKFTLNRVIDGCFYYSYAQKSRITLQLVANNHVVYSSTFNTDTGFEYYMGHPTLYLYKSVRVNIFDENEPQFAGTVPRLIESHVIDHLEDQPGHICKFLSDEMYQKHLDQLNMSYWEYFIENVMGFTPEELSGCDTVVDLGSNIGMFAKYASQYSDIKKYIGVEPNIKLRDIAEEMSSHIKSTMIYESLFSEVSGEIQEIYQETDLLDCCGDTMFPTEMQKNADNLQSVKCMTITLRDIIESNNIDMIDFMKVDIEGAECFLFSSDNYSMIKSHVKRMMIEVHTDALRAQFADEFNRDGFKVTSIHGIHYHVTNYNLIDEFYKPNKDVLVVIPCPALGDTLCATPTIRKIVDSYGHNVSIQTNRPDIFARSPYIDQIYDFSRDISREFKEVFTTYNVVVKLPKNMSRTEFVDKPMEIKLANFEARQLHALSVGLTLYPKELTCDYFPDIEPEITKQIDKNWIVLHTTGNWENRTWPAENWERLADLIKSKTDLKIALIGTSHFEYNYKGTIQKSVLAIPNADLNLCGSDITVGQVLQNDATLNQLWHVLNNALALVSFDSGPIHLAGTTDSHIIQIGASISPLKTAPWRHGSQDYKFHYIGGECTRFCGTDPKYSVKEWGSINAMPYLPACQEKFDKFYCQPTADQVFTKILDIIS